MHDFLIENSIMYKELVKEGEVKGIEIGRVEGIKTGLRQSVEAIVEIRFPDLLDLARERVAHVQNEERLRQIHAALVRISTEGEALRFLTGLPDERA